MSERWKEIQRRLDEEMREKLLSIQALTPLPRRRVPWPWEDLASLISRTTEAMGYPSPSWILRPESAKHSIAPNELPMPSRQEDYQMLSKLLDLDETTLRSLTLHRFSMKQKSEAEATYTTKETLFHIWRDDPLFRSLKKTTQICPSCLDEQKSYDRLYWRAKPLLLCPRHRVFLIQTCPACHRPIPTPRLHLSTCPYCESDYRKHIVPLAPEADWLLSSNIAFLTRLNVDESEFGSSPINLELSLLHNLSPYEYRWMITKFSVLFEDTLYRKKLLPFLLRALPVDR